MERVLVTGGAGFIGVHLVRRLAESGAQVAVLDDLSTGRADAVAGLAELHVGSVLDRALVSRLVAGADACFHLAAVASVARSEALAGANQVNLDGFRNVADAVAEARRDMALVYASSAAVYGAGRDLPLDEDAAAQPTSAYGRSKLGCEQYANAVLADSGVSSVGLRLFNVFGPDQDPVSPCSGVIARFSAAIATGEVIVIDGDGAQTRDFVFVSDVVDTLVRAAQAQPAAARIFNVCSGRECSILEAAEALGAMLGAAPRIRFGPAREREVRRSVGDPRRLQAELGVGARVSFEDGLARLGYASSAVRPQPPKTPRSVAARRRSAPVAGLHGGGQAR